MIIERNVDQKPLPLYEVEEVTVEQALCLLSYRQKYLDSTAVSRAGERLNNMATTVDNRWTMERFQSIWGADWARD